MDTTSWIQLAVLVVLICLSAYFSAAETALTTVSQVSMQALADDGNKRAKTVLKVISQRRKMLNAILICNNAVNISASALFTAFTIRVIGVNFVSIMTIALTVAILIFGEITPKTAAMAKAQQQALRFAPVIRFFMIILTPVIVLIDGISCVLLRLFGIDPDARRHLTENELKTYVKVGHEDGILEDQEKKIIDNLFDFGDTVAHDVMLPREDMSCLPVDVTYEEAKEEFRKNMYTRIPIYEDDPDNIIGLINIKDFILIDDPKQFSVRSIMRKPYYTHEFKKTADLLREMQRNSVSMVFVMNEYGSAVGMITLEDLFEELVGEIRDEYDKDEIEQIHRYDDCTFLIEASMKLDDINETIGSDLHSEDFDSIGGLLIEALDHLPKNNEQVTLEDGTVLQAKGIRQMRIVKVLVRFPEAPHLPEEAELP